ncbi:MAG: hypothetical protein ACJ75N_10455 [Actinomycetes bacterium]
MPLTGQATVQRQAQVGEDLLVGAGQATIDRGARIGGDLIFGAGRMTMDGTVAGSVLGSTGSYTKGGSVAGTEQVNVGQPQERQEPTLADRLLDGLRRYVSVLVVGGLLLWLLPRLFRGAAETVRGALPGQPRGRRPGIRRRDRYPGPAGPGHRAGGGRADLLGLGSLTGVTVFGGILVAAVVVFLLVLALVFAAPATVGLALGRLLVRGDGRSFLGWLGALALGVLVVAAIPVVGGWLEALLVLLGLGALLLTARPGRRLGEPSGLSPADAAPGR